jgi:hypothetical protein
MIECTVTSFDRVDRRTFLFASFAVAGDAAVGKTGQPTQLVALTEWLSASRKTRKTALLVLSRSCSLDGLLHPRLGSGAAAASNRARHAHRYTLRAKDIMETRSLSTEYGSPIACRPPRATRVTWSTRPAAAQAIPRLRLQPGWCRLLSELRLGDQYCDLLPFVV